MTMFLLRPIGPGWPSSRMKIQRFGGSFRTKANVHHSAPAVRRLRSSKGQMRSAVSKPPAPKIPSAGWPTLAAVDPCVCGVTSVDTTLPLCTKNHSQRGLRRDYEPQTFPVGQSLRRNVHVNLELFKCSSRWQVWPFTSHSSRALSFGCLVCVRCFVRSVQVLDTAASIPLKHRHIAKRIALFHGDVSRRGARGSGAK